MRKRSIRLRRALLPGLAALVAVAALAAIAMAAAGTATSSKARVKVKCPRNVLSGKKVTCKVLARLPRGPQGRQGPKGAKGPKGSRGEKGAAGSPGVSGYEIVSELFEGVTIENSGGMRGLSAVQTVNCPGPKRVVGGGADLGTNPAQNGQQRSVTVSLSAPNGAGTGWSVQLFNEEVSGTTSIDLRVYAICARAG